MKEIFPNPLALLFVCIIAGVIFFALLREGEIKKQKQNEKEKIERESWHVSKPDPNF